MHVLCGIALARVPPVLKDCSEGAQLQCKRPEQANEPCRLLPWPLRKVPHGHAAEAHGADGIKLLRTKTETLRRDLVDALARAGVFTSNTTINFGAGVSSQNPWYDLATGLQLERKWTGVNFDSMARLNTLRTLARRWTDTERRMSYHPIKLSPSAAPAYLRKISLTPATEWDVLKIDIDSTDCALARALLQADIRPKLVQMEL